MFEDPQINAAHCTFALLCFFVLTVQLCPNVLQLGADTLKLNARRGQSCLVLAVSCQRCSCSATSRARSLTSDSAFSDFLRSLSSSSRTLELTAHATQLLHRVASEPRLGRPQRHSHFQRRLVSLCPPHAHLERVPVPPNCPSKLVVPRSELLCAGTSAVQIASFERSVSAFASCSSRCKAVVWGLCMPNF